MHRCEPKRFLGWNGDDAELCSHAEQNQSDNFADKSTNRAASTGTQCRALAAVLLSEQRLPVQASSLCAPKVFLLLANGLLEVMASFASDERSTASHPTSSGELHT